MATANTNDYAPNSVRRHLDLSLASAAEAVSVFGDDAHHRSLQSDYRP